MNKQLSSVFDLRDLRTVFVGHCKELSCKDDYIEACEHKFDSVENTLKELEKRDLVLTSLKTAKEYKLPLSQLFNGMSQEERYKYTEHIYYTYSDVAEKLEKLEARYRELKEANEHLQDTVDLYDKNFGVDVFEVSLIDKKLQAFEILNKKHVDIHRLKTCYFVTEYNKKYEEHEYHLDYDEFHLLKEVL